LQFSGMPALDARRPGGLFPPLESAPPSQQSIARCSCGSSRMSCYGLSRPTKLPISAPGGSNEVVLGVGQVGLEPCAVRTHWITTTCFMRLLSIPRLRAYLGATCPLLVMVLRIISHKAHSSTSLQITRRHDRSCLSWYLWLRSLSECVCRRSWASRRGWLGARRPHEATMQEIETRAAKHLPLQHLEAVDVPLDWAIGPGQGHTGFDGCIVVLEPGCKAAQGLQWTGHC